MSHLAVSLGDFLQGEPESFVMKYVILHRFTAPLVCRSGRHPLGSLNRACPDHAEESFVFSSLRPVYSRTIDVSIHSSSLPRSTITLLFHRVHDNLHAPVRLDSPTNFASSRTSTQESLPEERDPIHHIQVLLCTASIGLYQRVQPLAWPHPRSRISARRTPPPTSPQIRRRPPCISA